MAHLYYSRDGEDEKLELPTEPFIIGRFSSCHLSIEDTELSRQHCQIECEDGSYYVRDLHSQNGTQVNGRPVSRHRLSPGDVIAIGNAKIVFEDPSGTHRAPPDTPTPPPPEPPGPPDAQKPDTPAAEPSVEHPEYLFCCVAGERTGEEYLVGKDGLTIGRRISHAIVLDISSVSSDHAWLRIEGGQVRIFDWESRNGVLVNGVPIETDRALKEGDLVRIGEAQFQLRRRTAPKIPGSEVLRRFLSRAEEKQARKEREPRDRSEPPAEKGVPTPPARTAQKPPADAEQSPKGGASERDEHREPRSAAPSPQTPVQPRSADRAHHREPKAAAQRHRGREARPAEARRPAGRVSLLVRVMSIVGPLSIIAACTIVYYHHQFLDRSSRAVAPPSYAERVDALAAFGLYVEAHELHAKAEIAWAKAQSEPAGDARVAWAAIEAMIEAAIERYKLALEMRLPDKHFRTIENALAQALRLRDQILSSEK